MAKDFSNPKKLGFMRVLQFFFAFNVIVTISLLAFLIKGSYELEFSNILDFVNLIFDSISFWLIWQRKRLARHFIIGFSCSTSSSEPPSTSRPVTSALSASCSRARPTYTARVLPHVETRESRADAALRRRGQTTRAREGPGLLPASDLGVLAQHHHLLLRVQRGGTLDGGGLLHAHPLRNDTRHLRPELPDLVGLALPLHRVRVRSRGVRASAVPRQELP